MIYRILFLLGFSLSANAFEIKGIEVGKEKSWLKISEELDIHCTSFDSDYDNPNKYCSGKSTLLGNDVFMHIQLKDNKVDQYDIEFDPDYFDEFKIALIKKFGKKFKTTKGYLQNSFGTKYLQEHLVWKDKEGNTAEIRKYTNEISKGRIEIYTKSYIDKLMQDYQKSLKDI